MATDPEAPPVDERTRAWRELPAVERALWVAGGDPVYRTETQRTCAWLINLLMDEREQTSPPSWWKPGRRP